MSRLGTHKRADSQGILARLIAVFAVATMVGWLQNCAWPGNKNGAPSAPHVTGDTSCSVGDTSEFAATSADPEGSAVAFRFVVGDNDTFPPPPLWTSYFPSDTPVVFLCVFSSAGDYGVRAQARDVLGDTSAWSGEHLVIVRDTVPGPGLVGDASLRNLLSIGNRVIPFGGRNGDTLLSGSVNVPTRVLLR